MLSTLLRDIITEMVEKHARVDYNSDAFSSWFGCDLNNNKFDANVSVYFQTSDPVTFTGIGENIKIVRAPMGSGKTTALIEWLCDTMKEHSVLAVSCRRTFALELRNRFRMSGIADFDVYSDFSRTSIDSRYLIVQIESLHRVCTDYEVVILDEVMSIISQFFSKTMQKTRDVENKFFALVRRAKFMVIMDATINRTLVDFISRIRRDASIALIINSYSGPNFARRAANVCKSFHRIGKSDGFLDILRSYLSLGKKICVFCSTVSSAKFIHDTIRETHAEKKMLIVTAKHGGCDSIQRWRDFDVVIYNSVVTVGLSFDVPHFHSLFIYIHLFQKGPDIVSIYQSMGRIRVLIDNSMYIYINPVLIKSHEPTSPISLPSCGDWSMLERGIVSDSFQEFKEKCDGTYFNKWSIRHVFRMRYYIERTTLNSLSDTVTLLCILLNNNKIGVYIDNNVYPLHKNTLFEILKTMVHTCSHVAKITGHENRIMQNVRQIVTDHDVQRNGDMLVSKGVEVHRYFLESVNEFSNNMLSINDIVEVSGLVERLRAEVNRHAFSMTLLSRFVTDGLSEEESRRIFHEHVQRCRLPADTACAAFFSLTDVIAPYTWKMLYDIAVLGSSIHRDLGLSSCTDTLTDIKEDAMLLCAARRSTEILRILQIVFTCHIQFFERYDNISLRLFYKLKGMKFDPFGFNVSVFSVFIIKMFFKSAYNMHILKSAPRYVAGRPFRSLRKNEIEAILDDWKVSREHLKTHKALRSALSEAAKLKRDSRVYKLSGFNIGGLVGDKEKWMRLLRGSKESCATLDCIT